MKQFDMEHIGIFDLNFESVEPLQLITRLKGAPETKGINLETIDDKGMAVPMAVFSVVVTPTST